MNIVSILKERNLTICTAESLTAGLVASSIASISGASSVLLGSVVAYSKDIKASVLLLDRDGIDKYGVYSNYTTTNMAKGAKKIFNADIAIATSGVAGPSSDEGVEAGSVYFTIIINNKIYELFEHFNGSRNEVRAKASEFVINRLQEILLREKNT